MYRVGISFKSDLAADEIRTRYIEPLRRAIEEAHAGIYSNYLRQAEADPHSPDEHLLVFEVFDFKAGVHLLRIKLHEIGRLEDAAFHNLDPSEPMY